jgi:hypothetical protein
VGRGGLVIGLLVLHGGAGQEYATGSHVETHELEGLSFLGEGLDEGRMRAFFEDFAETSG